MTTDDRLSQVEIDALTPGLSQAAAKAKELRRIGIRAEVLRNGEVLVLRVWLTQDCRRAQTAEPEPELNL